MNIPLIHDRITKAPGGPEWLAKVAEYAGNRLWILHAREANWRPVWVDDLRSWADRYWAGGWTKYYKDRHSNSHASLHDGTYVDIAVGLYHLGCPAHLCMKPAYNSWAMAPGYAYTTFRFIKDRPSIHGKPEPEPEPEPPVVEPEPEPEPPVVEPGTSYWAGWDDAIRWYTKRLQEVIATAETTLPAPGTD